MGILYSALYADNISPVLQILQNYLNLINMQFHCRHNDVEDAKKWCINFVTEALKLQNKLQKSSHE